MSAQNIWIVDNSTTLRMEANLVGEAGDNAFIGYIMKFNF